MTLLALVGYASIIYLSVYALMHAPALVLILLLIPFLSTRSHS